MNLHVLEQLARHARERPDHPALVQVTADAPAPVSYACLHRAVTALAARLADQTRPGEVVMLSLSNRPTCVAAYLAALAADLTIFPVYPQLTDHERQQAAQRTDARVLIGPPAQSIVLQRPQTHHIDPATFVWDDAALSHPGVQAARDHAHAAMLLQSSGTMGPPKLVRRSGAALDAVARQVAAATGLTCDDRVLAAVALCHSYGVENGLLAPILAGATVHLHDGFNASAAVAHMETAGITVFPCTPFMLEMVVPVMTRAAARDLRLIYSAGACLPPTLSDAFTQQTGRRVGQLYGLTEVGSVTFSHPDDGAFEPHSVGRPMEQVSIRILDAADPAVSQPLAPGVEGHVAIRAASMLDAYVDEDASPLTEGCFLTGDLGLISDQGNLVITGRVNLRINVGGMKVNPLEIEQVLLEHPKVGGCVVLPMVVTPTLDRLCAVVTPKDASDPPDPEALRAFVRSRLASYKVPRMIDVRASLPRTPGGKVLRREVSWT